MVGEGWRRLQTVGEGGRQLQTVADGWRGIVDGEEWRVSEMNGWALLGSSADSCTPKRLIHGNESMVLWYTPYGPVLRKFSDDTPKCAKNAV